MSSFAPTPPPSRRHFSGTASKGTYVSENFSYSTFDNVGAKGSRFELCNFNFCLFDMAYFKEAEFFGCTFIGARFRDSNFRQATFERCDFSYASFEGTLVPEDQVLQCWPLHPNQRLDLARSLRANFTAMGHHQLASKFFRVEMVEEGAHLRRAALGSTPYYAREYPGLVNRVAFGVRYLVHGLSERVWGHGESPWKLARSTVAGLALLSASFTPITADIGGTPWSESPLGALSDASFYAVVTFFSSAYHLSPLTLWAKVLTNVTLMYGYSTLGLLVAVTYRRLART